MVRIFPARGKTAEPGRPLFGKSIFFIYIFILGSEHSSQIVVLSMADGGGGVPFLEQARHGSQSGLTVDSHAAAVVVAIKVEQTGTETV